MKKLKRLSLKSIIIFLLLFCVLIAGSVTPAAAVKYINVTVNGKTVDFDVKPYVDSQNRTIVPLRFVGQEMGYDSSWNSQAREVMVQGNGRTIILWIGKKTAQVNGQQVVMDTVPVISSGRAMVPLRFVLENMGAGVEYNKAAGSVNIVSSGGSSAADSSGNNETISGRFAVVSEDVVNIRSGPGTSYTVLTKVSMGQILLVSARNGEWYQVTIDGGKTGWIAGWLVAIRSLDDLASRSEEPGEGRDYEETVPDTLTGILEISAESSGDEVFLSVKGDGKLKYSSFSLSNPRRLVLDFSYSELKVGEEGIFNLPVDSSFVESVRTAQFTENQVRLVVDLKEVAGISLVKSENDAASLVFKIGAPTIAGKTIVLDPGHASIQPGGWADPGAVGPSNLYEKDVVLDIAFKVKAELENKGANVIMTRTGNTTLTLAGRADVANNNNADIFVSIHANANPSSDISGTSTYYYAGESGQQEARWKLAQDVQSELVAAVGRRNIGVLTASFAVLRYTKMPSILVETAFISNYTEEKLLADSTFRAKTAVGIANGIEKYFIN